MAKLHLGCSRNPRNLLEIRWHRVFFPRNLRDFGGLLAIVCWMVKKLLGISGKFRDISDFPRKVSDFRVILSDLPGICSIQDCGKIACWMEIFEFGGYSFMGFLPIFFFSSLSLFSFGLWRGRGGGFGRPARRFSPSCLEGGWVAARRCLPPGPNQKAPEVAFRLD